MLYHLLRHNKDWIEGVGSLLPFLHKAHQVDEGLGGEWCLLLAGPAVELKHLHNGDVLTGISQRYTGDVLKIQRGGVKRRIQYLDRRYKDRGQVELIDDQKIN